MNEDNILEFPQNEEASLEGPNTITLVDEDGNEIEMAVVTIMEHEGSNYLVLLPVENMENGNFEVSILKVEVDEDGNENFVSGDTPDYDAVFEEFQAMLEEEANNMDLSEIEFDEDIPSLTPES